MPEEKHERRFNGQADRLRSAERLALLEVGRVVMLSTQGLTEARILDIGTGTGVFAEAFAANGFAVAGIDTNPTLLELARHAVPGAEFKEGGAEALPYADQTFDMAFLGHVLHETDDPLQALKEARRVARTRVVVLEWPYRQEDQGPPLAHRLRVEAVLEMAQRAGLKHVEHLQLMHMDLYRMAPQPL